MIRTDRIGDYCILFFLSTYLLHIIEVEVVVLEVYDSATPCTLGPTFKYHCTKTRKYVLFCHRVQLRVDILLNIYNICNSLVNVVLVKNEWSAAQTRVDSKTSVTVYTILEHLQVSRPRLAPILAFSI